MTGLIHTKAWVSLGNVRILGYDGRVYETKWLKGGSAGDTFQKDKYKPAPSD